MPGDTSIGWTNKSWNNATGCFEVSPGCAHCYAKTFAERWRGVAGHAYEQGFDLRLWPERMDQPLRWTKPQMIFVNSMSDWAHEEIPVDHTADMFAVMSLANWHVFQALTKRPDRMHAMLTDPGFVELVNTRRERREPGCGPCEWPLPNVWLGVSIENRRFVDRADVLRATPAAIRFISAEPLLGPLRADADHCIDNENVEWPLGDAPTFAWRPWADGYAGAGLNLEQIDWLIVGGESGPGAREMREEWARDLIVACQDECWQGDREGVTVPFMKQMGAVWAVHHGVKGKAEDPSVIPEDIRIQAFPAGLPALPVPSGPPATGTLF